MGYSEVKYQIRYDHARLRFEVRDASRSGRLEFSARPMYIQLRYVVEVFALIRANWGRARKPYVKEANTIPARMKFNCRALYDALKGSLPPEMATCGYDNFRGNYETDGYRAWYLNPMRILHELGLVRFGKVSWRLE